MNLDKFPQRQNPTNKRLLYFEYIEATELEALALRGYTAVHLASLPRETEADHKAYLMALTQGMAEGTITADRSRLDAVELDLRAHGMLNKDVTHTEVDRERDKTVEELLQSFEKRSRHVLFTTTIQDPKVVEAFLMKEAGLAKAADSGPEKITKRMWRRKRKGAEEEE